MGSLLSAGSILSIGAAGAVMAIGRQDEVVSDCVAL